LTVSGCIVSNNTGFLGGGILDYGTLTVSNSTLTGNTAYNSGGGIMLASGIATATVKSFSTITGNTAPAGQGADAYNLGTLSLDSTSTIGILNMASRPLRSKH
jgi:hypothetical protein